MLDIGIVKVIPKNLSSYLSDWICETTILIILKLLNANIH